MSVYWSEITCGFGGFIISLVFLGCSQRKEKIMEGLYQLIREFVWMLLLLLLLLLLILFYYIINGLIIIMLLLLL